MDSNLDKIALDLYGKIQTRFPSIKIGDENAAVLSKKEDIPKARFFEFEYEEDGESLGTIAITLDADEGIVVQVSGDLVDDSDRSTRHSAYKFIRSFRSFAKDRLLNFDVQNIGKSNLDKRDYHFQAKRKELPMEPMMENKMYGNNRMSYQDLGEARLVVKHSQPINLEAAAGRTMHIDSIYIENAQGERFRYPYKHLNGARALAEHIKAGGNPYDAIGKHITGLSEELASLRKFKGYVSRQEQLSEAMSNVTTRVMERIEEIKKTIQHLQRPAFYQEFAESFEAKEEVMIPEEVQNDLINRLTIRTFNEELKSVFPYIAKFVNEAELPVVELDAEDVLGEGPVDYDKHSFIGKIRRGHEANTKGWGQLGKLFQAGKDEKASNKALRNGNRYYNMTHGGKGSHTPGGFPSTTVPGLGKVKETVVDEGSAHGWYVTKVNAKYDQLKITKWLRKEAGLPKDAPVYFDDADLVWGDKTIVPNALVNPKLKMNDLLTALVRAAGQGQEQELRHGSYRPVPQPGSSMDQHAAGRGTNESGYNLEEQFESFIDSILSEDDDANATDRITQLNDVMAQELKGGPEGVNAIETLTGLINDPEFLDELKNIDPDLDVRPLVQQYLQLNEPEVAKQIVIGNDEAGGEDKPEVTSEPATAEPAPDMSIPQAAGTAEPAPDMSIPQAAGTAEPAPVAEGGDDVPFDGPYKKKGDDKDEFGNTIKHTARHLAHKGMRSAIEKAKKAGAKLDTKLDFGHKEMTLHDAMKECGMEPAEFGFEEPAEQGAEGMLNFVSGFYDKQTGSFPLGAERIKIKLKKAWEDGAFGDVDVSEVKNVFAFIDQKDPGSHPGHAHSDIVRLAGIKGSSHAVPKFDEAMDSLSAELNGGQIAESDELSVLKQLIGKI